MDLGVQVAGSGAVDPVLQEVVVVSFVIDGTLFNQPCVVGLYGVLHDGREGG